MANVAADAFTRRSGHVDPETGVYTPRGRSRVKVRAESRQYGPSDAEYQRVRAYRRRHPDPPEPRTPGKVRVRSYVRHRAFRIWRPREERDSQARWIAHLASYYGISRAAARKMERDTRP